MSLQARLTQGDGRLYNPARDVAHCFVEVANEVVKRAAARNWEALQRFAAAHGVTDRDIGRCLKSLTQFLASQADDPKETMAQGMARCGFLGLPAAVRIVVMAHLGTVIMGYHWAGVREATIGGQGPALDYAALARYGAEAADLMDMSRVRRWWLKLRGRVRRTWATWKAG